MKGFKPTGRGPITGHSFPSSHGFTESRGPKILKARGGSIHSSIADHEGGVGGILEHAHNSGSGAFTRGKPPITQQLSEHGGRGDLLDGYARGGMHKVEVEHCAPNKKKGGRVVEFKSGGRVVRFRTGGRVTRPKFAKGGHVQDHLDPKTETKGGGDFSRGGRPTGFKRGGKKWIKGAIKHPGALHQALHVPKGEKIPHSKIVKAEHSKNKTLARRAHLADTLGHVRHRKG